MAKTMACLQAFPSFLLPRAWSRALIPFPFPFERLPRRLAEIKPIFTDCWGWFRQQHLGQKATVCFEEFDPVQ